MASFSCKLREVCFQPVAARDQIRLRQSVTPAVAQALRTEAPAGIAAFAFVAMSISLRGPVARTPRISCVAAPCPASGGAGEFAQAGGIFIVNGHRSANRAGFRDVAFKLQEVRVRHNSVGNIDSEVVGRIACASLRHEGEVPGTIVGRSRMCGTC